MNEKKAQALVIDNGSHTIKAGFAGAEAPKSIFPSIVRTPLNTKSFEANVNKSFVGGDVVSRRKELREPIVKGIVEDWDNMEAMWQHTFENELQAAPAGETFKMILFYSLIFCLFINCVRYLCFSSYLSLVCYSLVYFISIFLLSW